MEYKESSREKHLLEYDPSIWRESIATLTNTLQLFITNKCNLRCRGCFYRHRLGKEEMSLEDYKRNVEKYRQEVQKVILLGGEPTIHPELEKMLDFNKSLGLRTTIYTNGFDLGRLEKLNLEGISIRVGVYGCENTEKPISRVDKTDLPLDIVYMLRRDIDVTGSFWKDTPETISVQEYAEILKNFVKNYKGNIPVLHIARRGVLYTKDTEDKVDCCRFGNIFPDGQKIICPFDISRNITSSEIEFNKRRCNKNTECILRKIVLKRI